MREKARSVGPPATCIVQRVMHPLAWAVIPGPRTHDTRIIWKQIFKANISYMNPRAIPSCAFVRHGRALARKDHAVHDLVLFRSLVCRDGLAIVRNVVHAKAAVKPVERSDIVSGSSRRLYPKRTRSCRIRHTIRRRRSTSISRAHGGSCPSLRPMRVSGGALGAWRYTHYGSARS
jgi:hypothetical protein